MGEYQISGVRNDDRTVFVTVSYPDRSTREFRFINDFSGISQADYNQICTSVALNEAAANA